MLTSRCALACLPAQMVLFRPMMQHIGPKNTITFAITVNLVFFVIYAADLVTTMELVYAMVAFGSLGYVPQPTGPHARTQTV
jgi:hypothetical protein